MACDLAVVATARTAFMAGYVTACRVHDAAPPALSASAAATALAALLPDLGGSPPSDPLAGLLPIVRRADVAGRCSLSEDDLDDADAACEELVAWAEAKAREFRAALAYVLARKP